MDTPLTTDAQPRTKDTHRPGAMYRRAELRHRAEAAAFATKSHDVRRQKPPELVTPAPNVLVAPPVVAAVTLPIAQPTAQLAPSLRGVPPDSSRPSQMYERMRMLRQVGVVLITAAGVTAWSIWSSTPPATGAALGSVTSALGTTPTRTSATTGLDVREASPPAVNTVARTPAQVAPKGAAKINVPRRPLTGVPSTA
jgi:hypothetical protein